MVVIRKRIAISSLLLLMASFFTGCTVPVIVKNDLSNPIPITDSHLCEPFAARLVADIPSGSPGPGKAEIVIPNDKRLVVETISIRGGIAPDADIQYASVTVITNGQTMVENITHNIVKKVLDDHGVTGPLVSGSQQTRLYADAGSTVTVTVALTKFAAMFSNKQNVWISGYLIPSISRTLAP